nr:response regulator [Niastella populi]
MFIDINMPDISGIDLVRSLQEKPLIIFTSAHRQFAIEGIEPDAVDYLLKPINIERFTRAVYCICCHGKSHSITGRYN